MLSRIRMHLALAVVFTFIWLTRSQVPCDDNTIPRGPDSNCDPGTSGFAGVPGLISTSTFKSCYEYQGILDCGANDNITVIELGIPPGSGETTTFDVTVAHTIALTPGASSVDIGGTATTCDAIQNGDCVVFRPATLEVISSPLSIVYDLRDTQHDTYYGYTPFHASQFDFTKSSKASEQCGVVKNVQTQSKLESSIFDDSIFYNRQCWPWEYVREASAGTNDCFRDFSSFAKARAVAGCSDLKDRSNNDYGHASNGGGILDPRITYSERVRSQYCRFPFPDLTNGVDRYGLIESDEQGYFRFKTRQEQQDFTCEDNIYDDDGNDIEANDQTAYPYLEHTTLAPSDERRCQEKYGILSSASPCAMWSGTFYDSFATDLDRIWDPVKLFSAGSSKYINPDPAGPDRAFTESRPILAGCPGPFYGSNRYLLPRRPDAARLVSEGSLSHAIRNQDYSDINLPYPTVGQCTNTDLGCCNAKIYANDPTNNNNPFYPFATCAGVRSETANNFCPGRLGAFISGSSADPQNEDDIMTNTDGMGFLYPQCRAWDINNQPQALYSLTVKLTDKATNEVLQEVAVQNFVSIQNDAQHDSEESSTDGTHAFDQSYVGNDVRVSTSRDMSVRLLNLDSTTKKLAQNLNGYIVVCNGTQSGQMFEGCGENGLDNPWDTFDDLGSEAIPLREGGGYTQFPTDPRDGSPQLSSDRTLLRRPCIDKDQNDHAWWYYTERKQDFGTDCGKLGIDELFFGDQINARKVCTSAVNACVPGTRLLLNGERDRWTYEQRLMDHWNVSDSSNPQKSRAEDEYVRNHIEVLTPCQQSGRMIQLEEAETCEEFQQLVESKEWPLPPGWIEFDGNKEQCQKPRYHVHGSRLVYSGNRRSGGATYIRAEIAIVGTVLSATTVVSSGRFLTAEELDNSDTGGPQCGVVLNTNDGSIHATVINTGQTNGDYRVRADCQAALIVGGVVDFELGIGGKQDVRVPIRDSGTSAEFRDQRVATCTLTLTHPAFSNIVFSTAQVDCVAVDADAAQPIVHQDFVSCATMESASCQSGWYQDLPDSADNAKTFSTVVILFVTLVAVNGLFAAVTVYIIWCGPSLETASEIASAQRSTADEVKRSNERRKMREQQRAAERKEQQDAQMALIEAVRGASTGTVGSTVPS